MANRQSESKKVRGLFLQPNSFSVPEGAFERLDNCVVVQDNIVQKRRGSNTFYDVGGVVSARNLSSYAEKLIGFCGDEVQVYTQDGSGNFSSKATLGGASFSIASGSKARSVQSNSNMYFTATEGIFKLESTTADVLEAGIEPATDLQVFLSENSATATFFRPNSQLAYRILFGRKDANANTVIGAPSQLVSATNAVLSAAATLASTTVTVTSVAHGLTTNDTVYVINSDSTGVPDGDYVITVNTVDEFEFEANTGSAGTTLDYGVYKLPTLDFAIPSGVSDEYLYRVYRSTASAAQDVDADESTLQLVDEQNLTSDQISVGFVIYKDETPDILRQGFLYTNPATGELRGILEANERPPTSTDVAIFKNHVFYANIQQFYALTLNLLTSNSTSMPDACTFTIKQGVTTRTYKGYLDPKVGNQTVRAENVSFVTTTVSITQTAHGFANSDVIAVAQALDSSGDQLATLPQGSYTVSNVSANAFDITAPSTPTGLVSISIAGISDSSGNRMFYIEDSANTTVASAIANTARAIVRAINRDASAPCFAYYTSPIDGIPGMMVLRSKETTATFTLNAVTSAIVDSFNPQIPTTGDTVIGTRTDGEGRVFFSKPGEPEAVPIVNEIVVGSQSSAILRIAALRDSLIVLKEDGVYRINGDNFSNFTVTVLDSTITTKSSDSVAVLDNQVYCFSEQGIVAISETAAQIISRDIEVVFTSVAGNSLLESKTHAFAYESERLYVIATITPDSAVTNKVYVYNHLTSAWSTWNDQLFLDGFVNPVDNKLYYLDLSNVIYQERKNNNKLDYTGLSYAGTVTSVPSADTAVIAFASSAEGAPGDVVVFNNIIYKIMSVSGSGASAVYEFSTDVGFESSDAVVLYRYIRSEIRTAPFYAGDVSVLKQFSEFQGSFRSATSCTDCDIYFTNDSNNSDVTYWSAIPRDDGWGDGPWGFFPWGDSDSINISFETAPAQPFRIYIPLETQRGTFIQANITHSVAAQQINLQSLAFTNRSYKQRTTK